jgi:solute carrier family 8 (sodium/calcium exchanger)
MEKSTYGYRKTWSWEYYDKFWYLDVWNQYQPRNMNLATISVRTYHMHQSTHIFPAVLKHWEVYQSGLIEEVKDSGEEFQTWSGDGRFDSMGHSAKYGVYTMWSKTTSKLVHFELLQV